MSVPENLRDIPVFHHNADRRPAPGPEVDPRIDARHRPAGPTPHTRVTLWVGGRAVGQVRSPDSDGPETVEDMVRALKAWAPVLVDLEELHRQERRLAPMEEAWDLAVYHGDTEDGPLLEMDSALTSARQDFLVLRAAVLARALTSGDRAVLGSVIVYGPPRPGHEEAYAHTELSRHELTEWKAWTARRDTIVIDAWEADLQKAEIHERSGIARSTVDRLLADF